MRSPAMSPFAGFRAAMAAAEPAAIACAGHPPPSAGCDFEALRRDILVPGGARAARSYREWLERAQRNPDYGPVQAFGRAAKAAGEPGIVFRSLRWKAGECLAILEGAKVRSCALLELLALRWDGDRLA